MKLRIVHIEDNPDDRRLVRRELEREFPDLTVIEVIDQDDLDTVLREDNFDGVVTDFQLRWTDGLHVLRAIKAQYPNCPVIMFTNTGTEEVAVEAMKSGLDDYLLKRPAVYPRVPLALRAAMERAELRQRARQYEVELENLNVRLKRAMQETHHRVKNNLQVLAGLAEMQIEGESVPVTALERIAHHARALAALHDLLTQESTLRQDLEDVSSCNILAKLVPLLEAAARYPLTYTCDDFLLTVRECDSLTLLASELVSNAVKHGGGEVSLSLHAYDSRAVLEVCDEGSGFPADFDPKQAVHTGLNLAITLARHDLRGQITFRNRDSGGASVTVTFPLEQYPVA